MAIQVLDRPDIWGQVGAGLGQGLGGGINALLQQKMGEVQQARQAKQFKEMGLPEQLAYMHPQMQAAYAKEFLKQPREAASTEYLANILSGQAPEQMRQAEEPAYAQAAKAIPQQAPSLAQLLKTQKAEPAIPYGPEAMLQQRLGMGAQPSIPSLAPETMAPAMAPHPEEKLAAIEAAPQARKLGYDQQRQKVYEGMQRGIINRDQGIKAVELIDKRERGEQKLTAEGFKESKAERVKMLEEGRASRQNLIDLQRMEDLEKEGKLDTPGYVEFLKRSGFDIPALKNPGSEEFQKIAVSFMRDARKFFGARISNYELSNFLQALPSLSQSPEGRKRVISNLKRVAKTSVLYSNTLKNVIKENNGRVPPDYLEQIDDKVSDQLDSLAAQFRKDLQRPVPKGQSKLITALQSAIGETIGLPGKLLGKAGSMIGGGGGEAAGGAELAGLL
jgi:hypothetical protein